MLLMEQFHNISSTAGLNFDLLQDFAQAKRSKLWLAGANLCFEDLDSCSKSTIPTNNVPMFKLLA